MKSKRQTIINKAKADKKQYLDILKINNRNRPSLRPIESATKNEANSESMVDPQQLQEVYSTH